MDDIKNDISLLSKVLNDDNSITKKYLYKLYDEFYTEINKNFSSILSNSNINNKMAILNSLSSITNDIEFFLSYPSLLGKSIVGIMDIGGQRLKLWEESMPSLFSKEAWKYLKSNRNVPCLLLHKKETDSRHLLITNIFNSENDITEKEFLRLNRYFYKNYNIDLKNIINTFSLVEKFTYDNVSIVNLPIYMNKYAEFNSSLLKKLRTLFIYIDNIDIKETNTLISLDKICQQNKVTICLFFNDNTWQESKNNSQEDLANIISNLSTNVTSYPLSEAEKILSSYNTPIYNYLFVNKIQNIIYQIELFYKNYLNKKKQSIKNLTEDLTKLSDSETQNKIKILKQSLQNDIKQIQDEQLEFRASIQPLYEKAQKLEEALTNSTIKDKNIKIIYSNDIIDIWKDSILHNIELNDYPVAESYVKKLYQQNSNEAYLYELLLIVAKEEQLPKDKLEQLKNEDNIESICHIKMRLIDYLNLSENDIIAISKKINHTETPLENYYKARGYELDGKIEKATKYYWSALKSGYIEAGEKLYELSSESNKISLEDLSNYMIPAANYKIGLELKEKKYAKSITNLKIAATQGYLPAIKTLSKDLYKRLQNKNLAEEEKQNKADICLKIYNYIIWKEPNNLQILENIGDIYKILGDTRRAVDYWEKSQTKDGYYKCGKVYQYGNDGLNQNLDESLKFLKKALDLGHPKADAQYSKVKQWIEKNTAKKSDSYYDPSRSYSSRTSYSEEQVTHSGCFITTAACLALNKGDDCDELMLLRKYRDIVKSENSDIAILIDEYYRIAPKIIKRVDALNNRDEIYLFLWNEYIIKTYKYIQDNNYKLATQIYIDMIMYLCNKYKISMDANIYKIIYGLDIYKQNKSNKYNNAIY